MIRFASPQARAWARGTVRVVGRAKAGRNTAHATQAAKARRNTAHAMQAAKARTLPAPRRLQRQEHCRRHLWSYYTARVTIRTRGTASDHLLERRVPARSRSTTRRVSGGQFDFVCARLHARCVTPPWGARADKLTKSKSRSSPHSFGLTARC